MYNIYAYSLVCWNTAIWRSVFWQLQGIFLFSKACRQNLKARQLPIEWIQSAKLSGSESDHTHLIPSLSMSGAIPPLHIRLSLAERNNFTFRKTLRLPVFIIGKWQAYFIIIIRHELGLNRPVSASSNGLFKGLPSRLRPFCLHFGTNSAILLLLILVTCRSQFDLYLLSYSPNRHNFKASKIS